MPAINFKDLDEAIKPIPAWRFYTTLPNFGGSSSGGQKLSFLVETFMAPNVGVTFEDAAFNAGTRSFPSSRTVDQIQIQLAENTSLDVLNYLRDWKNKIVNDRGDFGLPSEWKKDISIELMDETGQVIDKLSWYGCGPTRVDALTFDSMSSRHISINVTFVVDGMYELTQR